MDFKKFSFKNEVEWMLIFALLPMVMGILAFLALMVFFEV